MARFSLTRPRSPPGRQRRGPRAHKEWGEQVKAIVLLRPEIQQSEALAEELLGFARGRLASFEVPRSVDFVAELPRTPSSNLKRQRIRAPFWASRMRQI